MDVLFEWPFESMTMRSLSVVVIGIVVAIIFAVVGARKLHQGKFEGAHKYFSLRRIFFLVAMAGCISTAVSLWFTHPSYDSKPTHLLLLTFAAILSGLRAALPYRAPPKENQKE